MAAPGAAWSGLKADRVGDGSAECKFHSVIAEATAAGPASSQPSSKAAGKLPLPPAAALPPPQTGGGAPSTSKALPPAAALPPPNKSGAAAPAAGAPAAKKAAVPKKPLWVAPPAPDGKKYLPAFVAPEAYGKKKNPAYANIRQEVEEEIAKQAEEYKEKLAARRRKKKGNEQQEEILTDDGDSWELFSQPASRSQGYRRTECGLSISRRLCLHGMRRGDGIMGGWAERGS